MADQMELMMAGQTGLGKALLKVHLKVKLTRLATMMARRTGNVMADSLVTMRARQKELAKAS